jgi:hypothetical protein
MLYGFDTNCPIVCCDATKRKRDSVVLLCSSSTYAHLYYTPELYLCAPTDPCGWGVFAIAVDALLVTICLFSVRPSRVNRHRYSYNQYINQLHRKKVVNKRVVKS